jgi:hypothetical protein
VALGSRVKDTGEEDKWKGEKKGRMKRRPKDGFQIYFIETVLPYMFITCPYSSLLSLPKTIC